MTDNPAAGRTPPDGEPPQGGRPQQGGPAQPEPEQPGGYPPPAGYSPAGGYQAPGGYPPAGGYQAPGGYPPAGGYPAPGGYVPGQQAKVRPGRIWYLAAIAIFVAGLAWLIVGIVSISSTVNDLQRVPLPAGGTINLGHSGGYTVYYEGPGAQTGNFHRFNIQVAPASSGAGVPRLTQYGSELTYDIGGHQGRAVLTLHITGPGTFRVTTTGSPPPGSDLAFGGSIATGIVGALLPGLPLILIGVFGAVILLIIRIVRKRTQQRPPSAPQYMYPPS